MPPCDMLLSIGDGGRVWQAITRRQALVEGHRIRQFRSPNLALSRDMLKTVRKRCILHSAGVFQPELAVNKTQAAQYLDLGLLPEAWPETLSHSHAASQSHP